MAKILRKLQKIFAGSVSASGNIAQFGSLAAGSPAYSNDPDAIQTPEYLLGWQAATVGNNSPALQDDNALNYLFSRQLAYIFQAGIPEYDAGTEYHQYSLCQSGGNVYQSITNNNTGNPVTDTNNWLIVLRPTTAQGAAQAKVVFDGTGAIGANCVLASSFNVSSVLKFETGGYEINFTNPLSDANYAWSGSCGAKNGQAWQNGDDDALTGTAVSRTAVVTTTKLRVWVVGTGDNSRQNSSRISVIVV